MLSLVCNLPLFQCLKSVLYYGGCKWNGSGFLLCFGSILGLRLLDLSACIIDGNILCIIELIFLHSLLMLTFAVRIC